MNKMDTRDIVGFSFIWIGVFMAFAVPEHSIHLAILVPGTIALLLGGLVLLSIKEGNK